MRIALVHHQFGGGGGLEKYLSGLALHLAKAGHELEIVTSRLGEPYPEFPGARIHQLPRMKVLRGLQLLRFNAASKAKVEALAPDLILGFGQTVAQDIHRAGGGCHRIYSESLPPWKRFAPKNLIELDLERQLYTSGRTQHFVVNATKAARELQEIYQVSNERISVIHTPVDSERFRPWNERSDPPREASRQAIDPRAADRPVFLFVSLNHRRKGLDVLLDIWSQVEAQLWIVGEPLQNRYESRIEAEALDKKVRYLGKRDDLPELYRLADFFIHPTLYDACANTVLQSMASGVPGLISNRDGAVDFMEPGQSGFILDQPENPEAVLAAVRAALELKAEERASLGGRARSRMMEQTWDNHLRAWETLFEQFRSKD